MADYITRVELHGATEQDYTTLHQLMQKVGFHKSITYRGISYELPTAEYFISSTLSTEQLRDSVLGITKSMGKSAWVLVSQAVSMAWMLKKLN